MSFGRPFTSGTPEIFPSKISDVFWRYTAAIFWADLDTSDTGMVSWEVHTREESGYLLDRVDSLIQLEYGDTNFTGSWMLVGFWENVTSNYSLSEVCQCVALVSTVHGNLFLYRTLSKRF